MLVNKDLLMSTTPLAGLRDARLQKKDALRALGINPYPSRASRTHYAKIVVDDYAGYEGQTVTVAGRFITAYQRKGHHVAELDGILLAERGAELARLRHTTIFRPRPKI